MKKREFNKYLKERYEPQVKWYDEKAISNKRWNSAFQILVIVAAAVIPIFAILEYKWLTVVLSAIIAIGTGLLKYFKFEEHWHNYRTTCEMLKKEKHFYDAKIGDYLDCRNPEQLFVERVESLVSKEHTKWISTVKKTKNSLKKEGE